MMRYGVLLLIPVAAAGCVPLPYAYPTVSCTPPVWVGPPKDQVHAFRVDVREDHSVIDFNSGDQYMLEEIERGPGEWVLPQTHVAADYGFYWWGVLTYWQHIHHSILMRLYRAGYETIELQSWEMDKAVAWQRTKGLFAHEKAVDDLVATPRRGSWVQDPASPDGTTPENPGCQRLVPGLTCAAHRQALLFAAGEYERLAAGDWPELPDPLPHRERLLTKASRLRRLADEPPPAEAAESR